MKRSVLSRRVSGVRRGLTLVLALFVTFLLSTLSLAFVTLMMEDSSGSRQSAYQIMAAEGAEWGVETTLSYMGRGGNWQAAFDPDRLVFFDILNAAQPNGQEHLTGAAGTTGNVRVEVAAGTGDESAFRNLTIVDQTLPAGAALQLNREIVARLTVQVRPVVTPLASYGPGQAPQYLLISRCELVELRSDSVIAVSQLEAQVRPEVETTALFHVQNLRSWDVQGGGIGNPNTADMILIPSEYRSAGSVKVTGTDPGNPGAPWAGQSGNLRFQNPDSPDMVFEGQLSVSQLSNLDQSGNNVSGTDPANFPGGVIFGADFLPFPGTDRFLSDDQDGDGQVGTGGTPTPAEIGVGEYGLLAAAALDHDGPTTPQGDLVSGYYRVSRELVEEAHVRHPKLSNAGSGTPLGQQDYRPAIPEVEVKLKSGGLIEVNMWETGHGDGGFTSTEGNLNSVASAQMGSRGGPLGQTFHVDQLKNGILYVEGGQVVVHSELQGAEAAEFEGRIQIVAAEDATRRGQVDTGTGQQTYANTAQSLYHPAVADYLQWQESRLALPTSDPDYLAPDMFQGPPYTVRQLREGASRGAYSTSVADLAGISEDTPYWTPPRASVETEGNLVIAGDVVKADGTSSIIGLTAENYLFLNDRTVNNKATPNELVVEAVLTSFEHSLQFDWDNSSHNRVAGAYDTTGALGFDGKITLQGSMLAPYSDVEGDGRGRGYPRQEFLHDSELARWSPPFQPRTLLSEYPNEQVSISWSVVSFKDRTSKGVRLGDN